MKTLLLKIFVFILLAAGASKCGGSGEPSAYMIGFERVMTEEQIDSLCVADTLDGEWYNWLHTSFRDFETGLLVTKYSYFKELTDSTEIFYIITQKDSTYSVLKRIVSTE